jgi:uncharacterized LabA/DUF88 family protein
VTTQQTQNSDGEFPVVEQQAVSENETTDQTHSTPMPVDTDASSTSKEQEDEVVRPFSDFIEEFRQAEGQRGSSFQEPQAEPFSSLLFTGENNRPPASWENSLLETPVSPVESVGAEAPQASTEEAVEVASIAEAQGDAPIPRAQQEEQAKTEEEASNTSSTQTPPPTPAERPVSPLLRPARHIRLPRHGGRQRDVGAARAGGQASEVSSPAGEKAEGVKEAEGAPQAPLMAATQPAPIPTEGTEPSTEFHAPASSDEAPAAHQAEPAPIEEQPKPARRYRFDRRGSAPTPPATSTPLGQTRAEDNKDVPGRTAPVSVPSDETQIPAIATNGIQVPEAEQKVVEETSTTNGGGVHVAPPTGTVSAVPASSTTAQDRRQRHGQERQHEKEKVTGPTPTPTTPVVEVAAPVTEPVAPLAPEVILEDLPPLEYSELQAASSRRRRRRRSGSSTTNAQATSKPDLPAGGTSPVSNVTPMPSPTSPVVVPRNVTPGQYTIVSGYTVNQMNQGDGVGPFMGPEPTPARGSTSVRGETRSIRSEAQRAPSYPPVRTGEPSSASINQLANVIAQSISAQTDRMVAELRRANQAPTNVSVSLPPFPSTERVGVFVDVANLLYSARTLRMTIDFGKLLDFLRGNRRLIRAHAYCPTSPQPGDEQMFLQAVKGLGYRITTKNYKTFSSGAKKADMDLDLCMDVVRLVDGRAVDCIILVSGDSDFMPMLDYCSDHGVRVEVAAFDESMSATLRQSCDLFINLSMLDEIRA